MILFRFDEGSSQSHASRRSPCRGRCHTPFLPFDQSEAVLGPATSQKRWAIGSCSPKEAAAPAHLGFHLRPVFRRRRTSLARSPFFDLALLDLTIPPPGPGRICPARPSGSAGHPRRFPQRAPESEDAEDERARLTTDEDLKVTSSVLQCDELSCVTTSNAAGRRAGRRASTRRRQRGIQRGPSVDKVRGLCFKSVCKNTSQQSVLSQSNASHKG